MREVPEMEREEVRTILLKWGYSGQDLERMLDSIQSNPKAMLEIMLAFELRLSPADAEAPRNSGFLVGGATVFGHAIPLVPFFFVGSNVLLGAVCAIIASAVALFGIGWVRIEDHHRRVVAEWSPNGTDRTCPEGSRATLLATFWEPPPDSRSPSR